MRLFSGSIIAIGAAAMLVVKTTQGTAQTTDSTRLRDSTRAGTMRGMQDSTRLQDSTRTTHRTRRTRARTAMDTSQTRMDSTTRRTRRARTAMDTSQTRIRVSKSGTSGGEVTTRVDTVTVTRVDTVTVNNTTTRVDTVTVTRVDTVSIAPPPRLVRYPTGLYFGVGGGASEPAGSMFTPNGAGITGQAQLGIKSFNFPIGIRGDVNYLRPGQDSRYSGYASDGSLWNFNGDLTLDLPILTHMFGLSPRFNIYALGGASYSRWRQVFIASNRSLAGIGPVNATWSNDWQSHWGWNAGGGGSLSFGRTEIFVESRLISFTPDNATESARQIPFVVGVNLFSGAIAR